MSFLTGERGWVLLWASVEGEIIGRRGVGTSSPSSACLGQVGSESKRVQAECKSRNKWARRRGRGPVR